MRNRSLTVAALIEFARFSTPVHYLRH